MGPSQYGELFVGPAAWVVPLSTLYTLLGFSPLSQGLEESAKSNAMPALPPRYRRLQSRMPDPELHLSYTD